MEKVVSIMAAKKGSKLLQLGKKSKIPNLVIELFSETLARIGGEILMRQSR